MDALNQTRERTLALVADLDDEALHRPLDPIMSPLVWDLGHIAAYEDLWCVTRLTGEPLLRDDLAAVYDAFETPRAVRGDVELLRYDEALAYLDAVRQRTLDAMDEPHPFHELVLRHELQHAETMRQALFLGGLPGGTPAAMPSFPAEPEWLAFEAGTFAMGAGDTGFAYDNERPRHVVELPAFRIARTPVTNASWLTFAEGGGYERREWWSDEGWAWKEQYDITHPLRWTGGDDRPVQHVSWFEADAFARSLGARLPTEVEWERASAALEGVGLVWEWTSSAFAGYPGFRAYPYREYSEVFFGRGHRVLRGGSWAASPRVATRTFRNWDLPQRRQIFSGLRLVEGL
ncbi:MAG TPA: SUMF1/EgtB/PvdO family nonheme iron enzyme [Solirubrobacteraceae bacterium]|nr:SUMF1/EgtB/PvdO family nonheme iron enzyme [Solirubrobacteraceae bacterium]